MNYSSFVFDVSQQDFQTTVLENSFHSPVLVDFWAAWCQPCQILMPMLRQLAVESEGAFLLAKVNADEEHELAAHFGVRSLPTVKVFRNGQVVEELVGVQPESTYREIIERYRTKPSDNLLLQAEASWQRGDQQTALGLLREAQSQEPGNPDIKIALAEKLLIVGKTETAEQLLRDLPWEARESDSAKTLLAKLEFIDAVKDAPTMGALKAAVQAHPGDCQARHLLGSRLALAEEYETALEQFMEILRRDRSYGDDAGRKGLLAVFAILGDEHPLAIHYRRQMFNTLH
jgi:putative thioredoxin